MLRTFFGWPEEPLHQKRPKIDKKEANKIYDKTKRTRATGPSWKTEFKWLMTDDQEGTSIVYVYNILFIKIYIINKIFNYESEPWG